MNRIHLIDLIFISFLMVFVCRSIKLNQKIHQTRQKLKNNDIDSFRKAELDKHNTLRAKHNVPPLRLDDQLNDYAQKYAQRLAQIGLFVHGGRIYGQNVYQVWSSPPRDYKNGAATQLWYDQIKDYDWSNPSFSTKAGDFTQVIWKGSERVGFGIASTNDGKDFIVAEYDPPGNYQGQFQDNVLPL